MMTPGDIKKVSPDRPKLSDSEDEEDEGKVWLDEEIISASVNLSEEED